MKKNSPSDALSLGRVAIISASVLLLGAAIAIGVIAVWFPNYYTAWFLTIPLYFLLTTFLMGLFVERTYHKNASVKLLNRFMLARMTKIVVSVGVMILYLQLVDRENDLFLVLFLLFYIISMSLDIFIMFNADKRKRKESQTQP